MAENGRHSDERDREGIIFLYSKGLRVRQDDSFYKTRIQDVAVIVSQIMGIDYAGAIFGVLNPSLI
jgi:hypothetical protein